MFYGQYTGFGAGGASYSSLMTVLTENSLTTGLQFCLDAGDSASYSGSGQTWDDLSGNGQDFHLGLTSGAEASDPTFNGSAGGLSANEYWTGDGGDAFDYDSANETWMANAHLNGAKFAIFGVSQYTSGNNANFSGTRTGTDVGFEYDLSGASNVHTFHVRKGGGQALLVNSDSGMADGQWVMHAVVIDENGGSVSFFWENGAYAQVSAANTFDANYTSPAGTAQKFGVGTLGSDGTTTFNNTLTTGQRMAAIAAWSGTIPSKANLDTIYNALKARWSIT